MADLRLPKMPDRKIVRISIALAPELHRSLEDYATLYEQNYGEKEPIAELIPAMLSAFLERDRAFARHRKR